jgi:enoyl-CoA hydratase/carnithine racemase
VATLTLNRAEARNALSTAMCDAISTALDRFEDRSSARVLVLRGEGPVFCSGADLAAVSGEEAMGFLPAFERMLEDVARFPLPTIAAIHGAALGGGLQLATVCDFRIAADDARLGIPSSRLGIVVNFENVERLVLLAGVATAKEVLMSGRTYTGAEAASAGLVNKAVAAGGLEREVSELAREIASLSPMSVQGAKAAIQVVVEKLGHARVSDPKGVKEIDDLVARAYASEDLAEGLQAMAEKRSPRFKGADDPG